MAIKTIKRFKSVRRLPTAHCQSILAHRRELLFFFAGIFFGLFFAGAFAAVKIGAHVAALDAVLAALDALAVFAAGHGFNCPRQLEGYNVFVTILERKNEGFRAKGLGYWGRGIGFVVWNRRIVGSVCRIRPPPIP
jgi:hypothetical protein